MRTAIEGEFYKGKWEKEIIPKPNYRLFYFSLCIAFISLVVLLWGAHMAAAHNFNSLIVL